MKTIKPIKRNKKLRSETSKHEMACGVCYFTITFSGKNPIEIFKHGGRMECRNHFTAIARLMSISLRSGVDLKALVKAIDVPGCGFKKGRSCVQVMAEILKGYVDEKI